MTPNRDCRRKPRRSKPYYGSEPRKGGIVGLPVISRRRSTKSAPTVTRTLKHVDYRRLRSLPADILSRVCSFLCPQDLLALARTSRELREMFTDTSSKPYWDATRNTTGMPDWKTVSVPQAAAFLYEADCQAKGCIKEGEVSAIHLCRRYCIECAKKNLLNLEEVRRLYPIIPELLVKHLPWTSRRLPDENLNLTKNRFYLKSDVAKLQWRMQTFESLEEGVIARLKHELASLQAQRQESTAEIERWYNGFLRLRKLRQRERWPIIINTMNSRWGWSPVEYAELKGRLKNIVDYLLDMPVLSESAWDSVRGDIFWAIKQGRTESQRDRPRPFSL